jgi:hypothetical protein
LLFWAVGLRAASLIFDGCKAILLGTRSRVDTTFSRGHDHKPRTTTDSYQRTDTFQVGLKDLLNVKHEQGTIGVSYNVRLTISFSYPCYVEQFQKLNALLVV